MKKMLIVGTLVTILVVQVSPVFSFPGSSEEGQEETPLVAMTTGERLTDVATRQIFTPSEKEIDWCWVTPQIPIRIYPWQKGEEPDTVWEAAQKLRSQLGSVLTADKMLVIIRRINPDLAGDPLKIHPGVYEVRIPVVWVCSDLVGPVGWQ